MSFASRPLSRVSAGRFLAVLAAAAALAVGARAAEADVEFTALLGAGVGDDTRLLLTVKGAGQSRWLRIGQEFGGYTIASYEPKAETVVLTKAGQTLRVKLKESKVKNAPVEPPPAVQQAIRKNLIMLAAAADQFYLVNGVATVTYDQLVGPKNYVKEIVVQDGENYRAIEFKQGKVMEVTTAGGFKLRYAP